MSSFAEDMVVKLEGDSMGTLGTDIILTSRSKIPSGVGPITAVNETGGTSLWGRHNADRTANPYRRPSLQIVVIATNAQVARARAIALYDLFMVVRNTTIGGAFYLEILMDQSEPFDMGLDSIGRARFGFNIRALKTNT